MTAVGVALALGAAVANAYAVVLQAAEDQRSPEEQGMHGSLLFTLAHRRRWLGGAGLMALAGVAQITALGFAPLAIVQPTLAIDQLVLLVLARRRLGERGGPAELAGAGAIVCGIAAVVYAAPHHAQAPVVAAHITPPLAVAVVIALATYLTARARPSIGLLLVIGAGVAYACADFVGKLLENAASAGQWWLAAICIVLMVAVGAAAFLEETTALQHRPAVTVSPVIAAVKVTLPVLLALWAGIEPWTGGAARIALLLAGLVVAAGGAATLGRSRVVARISGESEDQPSAEAHPPTAPSRRSSHRPAPAAEEP